MGLKHSYHSLKTDPADPTIIGATKWNADHFYVDGAGAPIGNVGALLLAGAAGALTHLNSVAAGQVLTSAGVGALPVWAAPTGGGGGVAPGDPLQVDRLGVGVAPAAGTGTVTLAAAGVLQWAMRSTIRSLVDGTLLLANAAGSDFSLLRFGGQTNAYPALGRNGSNLQVLAADGSQYTGLTLAYAVFSEGQLYLGDFNGPRLAKGAGTPEGVHAMPVGSIYLRTDGGASTTLYVKQGGAATNTGWVAK